MNITLTGTKIMQDTKFLAFEKNNGVDVINITVDTDESWTYKLDVKYPDKCCSGEQLYNIINIMRTGNTCTTVLTKDMLPFTGKYIMQLRGISGDKVYHSDTFDAWIKYSIEPGSTYDPVPSEFYQIEDNITEINNNPPKPGENGYWLIWDVITHQYKESAIPLPDGTLPEVTADTSGKYLSNDGKKAYWAEVQTGTESKIDKIEVNGVEQPIVDKTVNIAVPTKTSDLSNDSGYITNEALDGYATKAELPTKVSQLENDSKFINESALDGYAKTADIPTKTSQLNNDSGYITANDVPVKSVDGETGNVVTNAVKTTMQTLTDAQKQQARTNIGAGTSSFDGDYNGLTNKPTIPTKTSELSNDSGFITEANIPVKSVNGKTGDVTLDAKSVGALPDTTVVPSKTSELDNDSGFITDTALTGYAKTTDIPTKTSQLENDSHYITASESPVQSVNNKTGSVTLSATDVSAIPSTLTGTAGQVLTKTADGQEWKDVDIPTALPNPNALTFTGAVTGSYDGSAPLSVEIPGGGSGNNDWELLADVTLTEDVATIAITQTPSGEAFSVRELVIIGKPISDGTNKTVTFAPYATEIKYGVELMSLGEVLSSTDGGTSYLSALIQVLPEVVYSRTQYNQHDNNNVGSANKLNASHLRNEANVSYAENGDPITKFAIGVWSGGKAGVFRAGTKMRVYGR